MSSSGSAVWEYFRVREDDRSKADCKLCSAKVSRGGRENTSFNTSNLIKHLKTHHGDQYAEFTQASSRQKQPTLNEVLLKREKMSKDSPRAKKITEALTQYIALDDQPISVVDDIGFQRLIDVLEPRYELPSRRYITDVMLPKVFDVVKAHVKSLVHEVKSISFTTDIWSSSVCPMSL